MIVRRTNNINRRSRTVRPSQSQHLLEVKMRSNSDRHQQTSRVQSALTKIIFVLILLGTSYLGGRALLDKFLFKNPDYNVKQLEVSLGSVLTLPELKALTGLQEGVNIFQLDLGAAEKLLDALPEVKKAHVERVLPSTIQVSLEPRVPIFRLAASPEEAFLPGQSLVMDQEGIIMSPKKLNAGLLELPLLEGVDPAKVSLGKPLPEDQLSFVLALWNALSNSSHAVVLTLRSIDLSRGYCAIVTDENNARFVFGEENLPAQCERLQKLFIHCQETGRQIETANLMLEHNTPVTFRLNAEAPTLAAQNKMPRPR